MNTSQFNTNARPGAEPAAFNAKQTSNVQIYELNNFARYPTLAIGYLIAPLREAGYHVHLVSPLNHGAGGVIRERPERWRDHFKRRVYFSQRTGMKLLRGPARKLYSRWQNRLHARLRDIVDASLDTHQTDVILLSAYLQHRDIVEHIARRAHDNGTPVLLGGPAFADERTVAAWIDIPGVTGIFAGEADATIVPIVKKLIHDQTLPKFQGVFTKTKSVHQERVAPSFAELSTLPLPDLTDFPWERYPERIIPVMTGRGCGWGLCTFCSDVTSANGRGFRSRPLEHVLSELEVQSERYRSRNFIFSDIKLNSDLAVWHGIIDNIQARVPDARWIATVHAEARRDHGLNAQTLQRAYEAGLRRISFGLESGSQRMLKLMAKGTTVEVNARFVQDAYDACLSVRATMIVGYPGERAEDLRDTVAFLQAHEGKSDRIHLTRFKPIPGTRFERMYERRSRRVRGISELKWDHRYARADYELSIGADPAYRAELRRLVNLVHRMNRRPIRDTAAQFDGLM